MSKVKFICRRPECDNTGERYKSQIRSGEGMYCSIECRNLDQSRLNKGENNPNWRGGISIPTIKLWRTPEFIKDLESLTAQSKSFVELSNMIANSPAIKMSEAIKSLESIKSPMLEMMNQFSSAAPSRQTIAKLVKDAKIDTSHFNSVRSAENILTISDNRRNSTVKKFILENNLIPYICSECNQKPEWNGKSLTLELEHINGNARDNRLENLTFLCPNCHTQTDTWCGRKNRKVKE